MGNKICARCGTRVPPMIIPEGCVVAVLCDFCAVTHDLVCMLKLRRNRNPWLNPPFTPPPRDNDYYWNNPVTCGVTH